MPRWSTHPEPAPKQFQNYLRRKLQGQPITTEEQYDYWLKWFTDRYPETPEYKLDGVKHFLRHVNTHHPLK